MLNLLRLINQARGEAGFEKIPTSVLRYRRRIVKPFEVAVDEERRCQRREDTCESMEAYEMVV
jgi:hypothetical protein